MIDMNMKINVELIKKLRAEKSWSQDELATAASLSLRTVQRIEKDGNASLESKKAIASAFEIKANDLDFNEESSAFSDQDSESFYFRIDNGTSYRRSLVEPMHIGSTMMIQKLKKRLNYSLGPLSPFRTGRTFGQI